MSDLETLKQIDKYHFRAITQMGVGNLTIHAATVEYGDFTWLGCDCSEYIGNRGTTMTCSHKELYWWVGPQTEEYQS